MIDAGVLFQQAVNALRRGRRATYRMQRRGGEAILACPILLGHFPVAPLERRSPR